MTSQKLANKEILHNLKSHLSVELKIASKKRQNEFLLGRYCAIEALNILQSTKNYFLITQNKDRSPNWPNGVTGSISHSKNFACAIVGEKIHWDSLGIDIELIDETKNFMRLANRILTQEEAGIYSGRLDFFVTLVFCAKETLYKALFPLVNEFFGFLDARIISLSENAFELELTRDIKTYKKGSKFRGCYHISKENFIITYIGIEKKIDDPNV